MRDLIYLVVGRILPPALRVYAPDVRDAFDKLDEKIYGKKAQKKPAAERLPLLELEDNGRLRPVVTRLTLRAKDGNEPDLQAFRDMVLEAMKGQAYLAPAAG